MGLTSYSVIADPAHLETKVPISKRTVMGKEISIVRGLHEFHYILVEAVRGSG